MADESNTNNQTQTTPPELQAQFDSFEKAIRTKPELIPDKYKDEDPEKAIKKAVDGYKALYADYTKTKQQLAEVEKGKAPAPEKAPESTGNVELGLPKVEPPKADDVWKQVITEVNTTGDLSPDLRAKLTASGVPEQLIDSSLRGMQAERKSTLAEAARSVGGDDELKGILEWGAKNIPEAERVRIDAGLKDPALWKTTLLGLKAMRDQARITNGEPVATPSGTPRYGNGGHLTPFASKEEQVAIMNTVEYKTQPRFQQEVAQRLMLTRQRGYGG